MLGPGTCLQTELEVGEGLSSGHNRREAGGLPLWTRTVCDGGMVQVCGPYPQRRPAYVSGTDTEEGRVGLGWFEDRFRVLEIPHVKAKEDCIRTGQLKTGRCSRNDYKGLGAPRMWSR